ncbi:MAG: helix-turn-helix transcriptional regulator [Candidatus Lokiarchaeota archaeon]|nr:helix-turn-helix transcriptional regulator [Candidatus Lokiarchaeota archaeon]
MEVLSHKQFVVLGLIAETPSHAYNINQRIDERGMRDWTAIGKSSIYRILIELENTKLVEYYEDELDHRKRKVYTITDYGAKILKEKVYNVIKGFMGKNDEDFYVAFSMLPLLNTDQIIEAFSYSIETMKQHKIELENMLNVNPNFPINVSGLFIHPIKILETDILFMEWVIEKIKEGDKYGKKIPSK